MEKQILTLKGQSYEDSVRKAAAQMGLCLTAFVRLSAIEKTNLLGLKTNEQAAKSLGLNFRSYLRMCSIEKANQILNQGGTRTA